MAQAKTDPSRRWPEERIEAAREVARWITDNIASEYRWQAFDILCCVAKEFPDARLDAALTGFFFREQLLEKPRVVLQ